MPDLAQILLQRRLDSMQEQAPNPYHDYARDTFQREDGSQKGKGFLGVFGLPHAFDPGVTSEYSIADSKDGPDYPSLVPSLNASELNRLLNSMESGNGEVPQSVHDKARQHAQSRMSQGKPVFAQDGEQQYDTLPMFRRIK